MLCFGREEATGAVRAVAGQPVNQNLMELEDAVAVLRAGYDEACVARADAPPRRTATR